MGNAITIGWASGSITPDRPVQLWGQYYERVSKGVRDPITATAIALEGGEQQAVIVSCDLVAVWKELQERVRVLVREQAPGLDTASLFLAATHTHTGPVLRDEGWYPTPPEGVMTGAECAEFVAQRVARLIAEAWSGRRPGGVSWAFGRASIGHSRRVTYADGTAQMYGKTDVPGFLGMEGGEDSGVEMLFTWDSAGGLTGVAMSVPCPSQVVEHLYYISADYWGEVRRQLRAKYGEGLHVLPLCGAAGDLSPRDLVRRTRGEADMWAESGLVEIGQRLTAAVEHALPVAAATIDTAPVFRHVAMALDLPARLVTAEEAERARPRYEELSRQELQRGSPDFGLMRQLGALLQRYEEQGEAPVYQMELHVLRLGDIALACNPFELYLDYALRMKARSKALQTFVVQLACDSGGYLPTAKAIPGGGYSARVEDGHVGPEGGQVLVDKTVELINGMWE